MLPSVAVPISLKNILGSVWGSLKNDCIEQFQKKIAKLTGFPYCILFSSGRIALKELLKELARQNDKRNEVIIPAYTCPTVLFSVLNADLVPVLADIEEDTFNICPKDVQKRITDQTLAIIVVHMFGKMANIKAVKEIVSSEKIFIIEDAAQATDVYYESKVTQIGQFGDFCMLSFGKGKNISTIEGGAILCRSRLTAEALEEIQNQVKKATIKKQIELLLKLVAFSIAILPSVFFWVDRLNFKLVDTDFEQFPEDYKFTRIQATLGLQMLKEIKEINNTRISNGKYLYSEISKNPNYSIPDRDNNLYLRFVMICHNKINKSELLKKLYKSNIYIPKTPFPVLTKYGKRIKNYNNSFSTSQKVFNRIIMLPTHPFVREKDLKKMIQITREN